ncbi:cobalamin biosynthesis protein [Methylocella tundrae]|uniref:Putative CobE protein n=1 Tax=Methylocella tundrae TaxID=227605 RepID=A0A4V6IMP2_METTU|nr:cobalamin biosynthesis protein [Methylocella tundrae]WPP06290.1 cobalamin biosynthesis protein [Methylocella tundrae]VFU08973.1 putative CobE protein [Methylocella tundrae]
MKIAIGVGCRKNCASETIVALVRRAIARAHCEGSAAALYSHQAKDLEPGLIEAAAKLEMPLVFLDPKLLDEAAPRAVTRSEKVIDMFGLPSIAETAALAGAGAGAELILARISDSCASCAIAKERQS